VYLLLAANREPGAVSAKLARATDPNSGAVLILLAACFWPPSAGRVGDGSCTQWRSQAILSNAMSTFQASLC